jgi:hypothetical protein
MGKVVTLRLSYFLDNRLTDGGKFDNLTYHSAALYLTRKFLILTFISY